MTNKSFLTALWHENLQTEAVYGQRYKSRPKHLFAVYPAFHRIFLGEKIVQGPGQVKRPGLQTCGLTTLPQPGAHRHRDFVAVGVVLTSRHAAGAQLAHAALPV